MSKHEHPATNGGGGDGYGRGALPRISDEDRADAEDAAACATVGDRLVTIAPLLKGVRGHSGGAAYRALAVQFDDIGEACRAIAEGLRIRADMKENHAP